MNWVQTPLRPIAIIPGSSEAMMSRPTRTAMTHPLFRPPRRRRRRPVACRKLARIAVENDSEWILLEVNRNLFNAILNTTKSDALSPEVENLGPTKAVARFRIGDVSV